MIACYLPLGNSDPVSWMDCFSDSLLAETPRPPGTMRLAGYDHWYRLRVRQYRVIYEVMDRIRVVTVIDVEHRRDVYQRLPWRRVETARGSILDRAVSFAPW
jgi:mRNA-degrading endonuclease RelE of RelBE toxin-antitoxin system